MSKTTSCVICSGTGWRNPAGWHLMRYCDCATGRALADAGVSYHDWEQRQDTRRALMLREIGTQAARTALAELDAIEIEQVVSR